MILPCCVQYTRCVVFMRLCVVCMFKPTGSSLYKYEARSITALTQCHCRDNVIVTCELLARGLASSHASCFSPADAIMAANVRGGASCFDRPGKQFCDFPSGYGRPTPTQDSDTASHCLNTFLAAVFVLPLGAMALGAL